MLNLLRIQQAPNIALKGCMEFHIPSLSVLYPLSLYLFFQVGLYTKQGSLKYQTDCAPNNGYYMIPVYDKGDYVLKVAPPPGWTFGESKLKRKE